MIILYTTVFIVVINTAVGVASIAPNKIWQPACWAPAATGFLPRHYSGDDAVHPHRMMSATGSSFTAVVAAQMVGAEEGLGYSFVNSRFCGWIHRDLLAILGSRLLGFTIDLLFRRLIRRFAGRYGAIG